MHRVRGVGVSYCSKCSWLDCVRMCVFKFVTSLPSSSLLITSQLVSIGWDSSTLLWRQTHIACDEAQARKVATTQLRDVRFLTSSANVSTFTLPVHASVLSRHAPVDVSHVPANHNTQDRHTRGSQRLKHGSGTCHVYVAVGFAGRQTSIPTIHTMHCTPHLRELLHCAIEASVVADKSTIGRVRDASLIPREQG